MSNMFRYDIISDFANVRRDLNLKFRFLLSLFSEWDIQNFILYIQKFYLRSLKHWKAKASKCQLSKCIDLRCVAYLNLERKTNLKLTLKFAQIKFTKSNGSFYSGLNTMHLLRIFDFRHGLSEIQRRASHIPGSTLEWIHLPDFFIRLRYISWPLLILLPSSYNEDDKRWAIST